jgi:hypothetical protein
LRSDGFQPTSSQSASGCRRVAFFVPELRVEEIELEETAAITVDQMDDEVTIASVVGVHFQVTADQAFKLSRGLRMPLISCINRDVAEIVFLYSNRSAPADLNFTRD